MKHLYRKLINGTIIIGALLNFVSEMLLCRINTNAGSSVVHCCDNNRYQKPGGWKWREPTQNGNVSMSALRPFKCQMCCTRRRSARTLLSSTQLIFQRCAAAERAFSSVPLWRRASSVIWSEGSVNATLFAFFIGQLMRWF